MEGSDENGEAGALVMFDIAVHTITR